jgi:polyphosphate glucokinase
MELLGIDIGGSGIKGAVVNADTGVLVTERFRLPTPQPSHPEKVADVVCDLIDHFNYSGPVGVTIPAIIKNGKCLTASNIHEDWKDTQVDELFKKYCNQDFFVLNDADAAAEAEMKFGAGKDKDGLVITITVGTGLGSGMFFNGELIPNIELGVIYGKDGNKIEHYAADSARKREDLSFGKWAKRLNFYLNHIELVMNPDLIIIGGGVSKKMDKLEEFLDIEVPIVPAVNQNNAGIIGAAMYALDNLKT